MPTTLNTAAIRAALQASGDQFVPDFRRTPIPQTMQELQAQLAGIEARCLAVLKGQLAEAFPATPWLDADEFALSSGRQGALPPDYWLCDAMDGAIQYVQQLPGWTINLVLMRDGQPYFAAIYDPLAQELFWAQAGGGAFLNDSDTPLHPSTKHDPAVAVAVFEHPHGLADTPALLGRLSEGLTGLLRTFGVVRNYGPHGLQLAYVGAGRLDVFYQEGPDLENWLPGLLIAQEAGAVVRTPAGQPWHQQAEGLLVMAPALSEALAQANRNFAV